METQALENLRVQGRRLTRQRRLVLEILQGSQKHLDAEALFELAKARDPKISLATVYRSLALLKQAGLVQEYRLGESHGHFESTPADPHYHFTCLKCGRVIEFEAPQVMEAAFGLCQTHGMQILNVYLHMSGYCADCRSNSDCT
jgi:Fe2+ or Zn2+ uptake regulation protein